MSRIKTAVIPVGGFGTRFLPATKSIPKEMFPIDGKPVVLHVVEEVVKSGITNIIFIVSQQKQTLESFFSPNDMMENYYMKLGKKKKVEEMRRIAAMADFSYVYKEPPFGNGGAILAAQHLLKNEPFVLVWGDELFLTKGEPRVKQCIDVFDRYQKPVISAIKIKDRRLRSLYGMADIKTVKGDPCVKEILRIVEKPKPGKEPSPYAAHGAYVLTPDIFDAFKTTKIGKNGELWLADLINTMKKKTGLLACIIEDGLYLDCGAPDKYLYSQIEFILSQSKNAKDYKKRITKILKKY